MDTAVGRMENKQQESFGVPAAHISLTELGSSQGSVGGCLLCLYLSSWEEEGVSAHQAVFTGSVEHCISLSAVWVFQR